MSSASSLPLEILTEIFFQGQDGDIGFPGDFDLKLTCYQPVFISQVCSRWRRLALNRPQLWSTLALRWDTGNFSKNKAICHMWLGRSGKNALTLSMEDDSRKGGSRFVSKKMLEAILPFKRRWKNLRLQVYWHFLFSPALATKLDDLPLLESLMIEDGFPGPETMNTCILPKWLVPVHLWTNFKRLWLGCDTAWRCNPTLIHFPWNRLTHLSFTPAFADYPALSQTLGHCSGLIFLKLTLCGYAYEYPPPFPLTTLPLLKILAITSPQDDLDWLLGALVLPSLTVVRLDAQMKPGCNHAQSILALMQDSRHPSIESIHLSGVGVYDVDLVALLVWVPQIVSLEVTGIDVGESFLKALTKPTLGPILRRLVLGISVDVSEETVSEFITMRKDIRDIAFRLSKVSRGLRAFLDANGIKRTVSKHAGHEIMHVNDVVI